MATMRAITSTVYHGRASMAFSQGPWRIAVDWVAMREMHAAPLGCCLLLVVGASACRTAPAEPGAPATAPSASASSTSLEPEPQATQRVERAACEAQRAKLQALPELPGAPRLESQRAWILGRAKGSPIVFARAPRRDLDALPAHLRALMGGIDDPRLAVAVMRSLRTMLPHHAKLVRTALLPEGYLYTETPETAEWLVTLFRLEHLFDEKQIWLLRGSELHALDRTKEGYRFAAGPEQGREASLLLFDRVSSRREDLLPALHADFAKASREHGFDRVKVRRITEEGWEVGLRYGSDEVWSQAVMRVDDGLARVVCEQIEAGTAAAVHAWRLRAREHEELAATLRAVVIEQTRENLPFDEPREEVGQQDGSLRPRWTWAYNHGWDGYSFNEIRYPVFDSKGRPHTPQVCIDFVLDTLERASGNWYRPRGDARERTAGRLDFEAWQMPNRRGVEAVVNELREHPEAFEVFDLPEDERVRYSDRRRFFEYLATHAEQFRPADVVVIHGPKGAENHYHSFFVFDSDPVTGMPTLLAGNAGRPRVKSWSAVMQSGPLRSIKHRLRPRQDWLRTVLGEVPRGDSVRAASVP